MAACLCLYGIGAIPGEPLSSSGSLPASLPPCSVGHLEAWATLFKLLEEGKIEPMITKKFPILEAAQANALLESGQVTGNVVLVAPELL